jgi:hypothetical protein
MDIFNSCMGTQWHSWLRHCTTNQKVMGPIPRLLMVSLEFFFDIILPSHTMALASTQPLTEMSTRNISFGRGDKVASV